MLRSKPPVSQFSWTCSDGQLAKGLGKTGMAILTDLNKKIPLLAIKSQFDLLYQNHELVNRLNSAYPKRGIFKSNPVFLGHKVDQKVPFDLSPARLQAILKNDPSLVDDLGPDFMKIVEFYSGVQDEVIPRLMRVASLAINGNSDSDVDLSKIHGDMNYNYRLVDYFPVKVGTDEFRCGEHRDYGTFTIIFQDQVGGLEIEKDGRWIPVPPPTDGVIFLWGWSATILSNGSLQAPLHRVVTPGKSIDSVAPRRNSAIFFVAPDLNAQLKPRLLLPGEKQTFSSMVTDNLSVDQFKNWMGARWRIREGTLLPTEEEEMKQKSFSRMTQDQEIKSFLNGEFLQV